LSDEIVGLEIGIADVMLCVGLGSLMYGFSTLAIVMGFLNGNFTLLFSLPLFYLHALLGVTMFSLLLLGFGEVGYIKLQIEHRNHKQLS